MPIELLALVRQQAQRLETAGVAFGQGSLNAFDEAAWLTLWRLGLPLDALDELADRSVSEAERSDVEALIQARIGTRQPAAYLTGEAWLQGVPFFIDRRSIVPRSFIAELIADASIDPWLGEATRRVLDLCTGNGSLAVLAALAWPEVEVVGADLSADALQLARRNVERHGLQDRIALCQGDGLNALAGQRFDLILCNPPYVNAQSMASLPPEFRAEPEMALAGGTDGMDFIRGLLAQARQHLSEDGVLVLEIGHERAHFEAAFPGLEPVWLATAVSEDGVLLLTREQLPGAP
jgi:ribosomal protein L3 glutamine methyltransferase